MDSAIYLTASIKQIRIAFSIGVFVYADNELLNDQVSAKPVITTPLISDALPSTEVEKIISEFEIFIKRIVRTMYALFIAPFDIEPITPLSMPPAPPMSIST